MAAQTHDDSFIIDPHLIRRYDRSGPRYTSYPTADRFVEAFHEKNLQDWFRARQIGGAARPLSVYVHLPFCATVCFYCGCNKVATKDRNKAAQYLGYLDKELALQSAVVQSDRRIEQMHWGGGTPTFLSNEELVKLMQMLKSRFDFAADGEYSVEIDPRTVDAEKVALLGQLGFNRMSIGVQDFDPQVQHAVNRIQSEVETLAVMEAAHVAGFSSINIDLIYGLPRQTVMSFNRTLDQVIAAAPDRIALYSYAHLPALFKPQRRINEAELPTPDSKLQIMTLAIRRLTDAGYQFIGMDHFARPGDELAVAQRNGTLHRNFQGYSTRAESDLLAFGVSAIGAIGPTYYQNCRTLPEYYDKLDRGNLPIMRGIELSPDDLARRSVIQSLMCNFSLCMQSIELAYLIDFPAYFATELEALHKLEVDGLLLIEDGWIHVTPRGRLLVRHICMVFDRYLRQSERINQYSKII